MKLLFQLLLGGYEEIIKMAEAIPVFIETSIENDFKITPSQLQNAITDKTKMMIYSSPCNPSGSVYSKDELRSLADVLVNFPVITVVSDEIYETLISQVIIFLLELLMTCIIRL